MPDLGIVVILITFFLFMSLCRPFVKALVPVEGFVWFPPLALLCAVGIFPAYGLRLECIPLLVFTLIYNILNFRSFSASISRLQHYHDDIEHSPWYFLIMLPLLVVTTGLAIRYLPLGDTALQEASETQILLNTADNNEYYLRLYLPDGTSRLAENENIIFVIPPVVGSVNVIDSVCWNLSKNGGAVFSYSRKKFDFPANIDEQKMIYPKAALLQKIIFSLWQGSRSAAANADGRFLEQERINDLAFLLPFIKKRFKPAQIFIAGYGAGGAAALNLLSAPDFFETNPEIIAAAAIESSFFGLYRTSEAAAGGTPALLQRFKKRVLAGLADMPTPQRPFLYLGSDWLTADPPHKIYEPALALYQQNQELVRLTALDGAGAVDYSDTPEKYPIIAYFLHGRQKRQWNDFECVDVTCRTLLDFLTAIRVQNTGTEEDEPQDN